MNCANATCNRDTTVGPFARYCGPCRSQARRKRKKYVPTEFIDSRIRRLYQSRTGRTMPEMKNLARSIGWPAWAARKRAAELGVVGVREPAWTPAETIIVEQYAWMCNAKIAERLKAAGFHRTATAVALKRKRIRAGANTPYYSARSLADCFGEDSHKIVRWVQLGYLDAKRSERKDMWLIHSEEVYRFALAYPMEYELRKVDQLWFLDLITQGKIAA